MQKTLLVYYSLDGNTQLIANVIAEKLNCDVLRIQPKREIYNKGFLKYVLGSVQVIFKQKPALMPFDKNIDTYNTIIIGSPVWAGTYTPAFNTFFCQVSIRNKKIALFCSHAGSEGRIFAKFKASLAGNEFLGQEDFEANVDHYSEEDREKNISKAKQWVTRLNQKKN